MDAPMSNDSADFYQKSGNGIKTGMRFDMGVRRDKDSSCLVSLYMPFVSVIYVCLVTLTVSSTGNNYCLLLEVDPSENQREPYVYWRFPWRVHYVGVRVPPRGRTLDHDQSFDLMDCLDLLWDGENDIFSGDDSPELSTPAVMLYGRIGGYRSSL